MGLWRLMKDVSAVPAKDSVWFAPYAIRPSTNISLLHTAVPAKDCVWPAPYAIRPSTDREGAVGSVRCACSIQRGQAGRGNGGGDKGIPSVQHGRSSYPCMDKLAHTHTIYVQQDMAEWRTSTVHDEYKGHKFPYVDANAQVGLLYVADGVSRHGVGYTFII